MVKAELPYPACVGYFETGVLCDLIPNSSKQCLTASRGGEKAPCLADQPSSLCPFFLLWILHLFFTLL